MCYARAARRRGDSQVEALKRMSSQLVESTSLHERAEWYSVVPWLSLMRRKCRIDISSIVSLSLMFCRFLYVSPYGLPSGPSTTPLGRPAFLPSSSSCCCLAFNCSSAIGVSGCAGTPVNFSTKHRNRLRIGYSKSVRSISPSRDVSSTCTLVIACDPCSTPEIVQVRLSARCPGRSW